MARIPIANKHEETAMNQHLVPQCYMREWGYNPQKTSVWLYEKNSNAKETKLDDVQAICASKSIKKINSIGNYYDIKAGCYFMPQEALDEIFGPTMHLNVMLNDENLDTEKKRNERFGLFDEWVITDCDGIALSEDEKEELKQYFTEARFVFIEKEWDRQYENNWRDYIKDLEEKIRKTKASEDCGGLITSEMISEIIKLLIVFDIRGFSSNEYINQQIDACFDFLPSEIVDMELEPEERMHPMEASIREAFKHQYILHLCYDILKDNEITGIPKVLWNVYKENLVPQFCLTDISHPFVTSERPAFINVLETGEKEHIFVARPTMLITMGRGNKGQFFICNLTKEEVDSYNRAIAHSNEHIISCTDQLDVLKIWG